MEIKPNAAAVRPGHKSDFASGMDVKSKNPGFVSTLLRACHPLIVFDAYTFRWLGFDPREHDNTREQAFNKVTNVGLISALVFTVWSTWIQVVADTSFASYGVDWADDTKGIAGAFLCTGTFFLLYSVINSVLVLLAVNETENDRQAVRLLQKLDLWFTLPSIYFYLGVAFGSFGFLIWFPAVFPLKYAIYNIVAGLTITGVNAPYYQFLILSVYDMREEDGLAIPSPPAWLKRLGLCHRSTAKSSTISKEIAPKPVKIATQNAALMVLERALEAIGQSALLSEFEANGWAWTR